MSLHTGACANVLFPLHEFLKGHDSVVRRKQLELTQWLQPEEIEALRLCRLKEFMAEVGSRVPYYRRLFATIDFDPRGLGSTADLAALPLLGKPEIRAHLDELKADGHGPLTRYNTGGSSGEPLVFYIGKARKSHDVAAKWRATRWWGVDIGDREVVVWGSPIELGAQDRLRRLRDLVMRSHLVPAFEMSEVALDRFVTDIGRIRPAMLFGYPSSLSLIAEHSVRRGIRLDNLGVRVAFVTAETLYPQQRAAIARAFGCKVANGYGSRDAGFIAHECPSGSLHISAEDIVVETVRPDGTQAAIGEPGEIVVTHMTTSDFPLLRYRTGDVGTLGGQQCACGRGLPVLESIQGRTTDFVVASDGTVMHGLALIYAVRDLPGIERFRIEQLSKLETRVTIVPGTGYQREMGERIIRDFKARLGGDVRVVVDEVVAIPPESSGKFRYVVSRVKPFETAAADLGNA